jgi:uncharacterized membrane protein
MIPRQAPWANGERRRPVHGELLTAQEQMGSSNDERKLRKKRAKAAVKAAKKRAKLEEKVGPPVETPAPSPAPDVSSATASSAETSRARETKISSAERSAAAAERQVVLQRWRVIVGAIAAIIALATLLVMLLRR